MITKFETSASGTSGKSNTLVYLLVGAVIVYLGYTYVIKPAMEKNKLENQK